jgi:cytochrome c-type biogenesis protein CcmE
MIGGGRAGLLTGAAVIVAAFGYLVYGGLGENLVYFVTPTELLARGPSAYDTPMRLGGEVKPGSIDWDADRLALRFALTDGEGEVMVNSRGAPPQMFRDGMGVVVEGRFGESGVFESTNLMVKHSNEYRAPEEGQRPQEIYHELERRGADALPAQHPPVGVPR